MLLLLAERWEVVWHWIAWGNSHLRDVLSYATFIGVMYTVWGFWRARRIVTIYVVNDESTPRERREVARLPASFVSRAEVMGLVAQAAGQRLDFTRFGFDYQYRTVIEVLLPAESFQKLGTP